MDCDGNGWRVITCAAGQKDETIINRIMLKFRPIAPKPVDGSSSSGAWNPDEKKGCLTNGRRKRKYVRVKKNIERRKRREKKKLSSSDQEVVGRREGGPTVQILPGETDLGSNGCGETSVSYQKKVDGSCYGQLSDRMEGEEEEETSVTVESVTNTCMDEVEVLGNTDMERVKNLERDTCPGFISDSLNRVQIVNEAYKRMVRVSQGNEEGNSSQKNKIAVKLEIKDKLVPYLNSYAIGGGKTFTCWVRLKYRWQKDKCSQMVPCDVWRMDFGGFAWRLDVKVALSLSLQSDN